MPSDGLESPAPGGASPPTVPNGPQRSPTVPERPPPRGEAGLGTGQRGQRGGCGLGAAEAGCRRRGRGGTGGLGAISDLLRWGPVSVCLPALAVCPSALGMVVEKAAASPPVPVGERRPQKQEPLGRTKKIRQQVTDGFTVKALMKNSVVRALLAHGGRGALNAPPRRREAERGETGGVRELGGG